MKHDLDWSQKARDQWRDLDGSIKKALKAKLEKRLDEPRLPGSVLDTRKANGDVYKVKANKPPYRLIYQVKEPLPPADPKKPNPPLVKVIRIGHREDVYDDLEDDIEDDIE